MGCVVKMVKQGGISLYWMGPSQNFFSPTRTAPASLAGAEVHLQSSALESFEVRVDYLINYCVMLNKLQNTKRPGKIRDVQSFFSKLKYVISSFLLLGFGFLSFWSFEIFGNAFQMHLEGMMISEIGTKVSQIGWV